MASEATATGSLGLLHRVAVAAAALVAGLALFVTGLAVGSARGESGKDAAHIQPLPDWFLPIWDAYDRNPAIGAGFDFASLYAPHSVNVRVRDADLRGGRRTRGKVSGAAPRG